MSYSRHFSKNYLNILEFWTARSSVDYSEYLPSITLSAENTHVSCLMYMKQHVIISLLISMTYLGTELAFVASGNWNKFLPLNSIWQKNKIQLSQALLYNFLSNLSHDCKRKMFSNKVKYVCMFLPTQWHYIRCISVVNCMIENGYNSVHQYLHLHTTTVICNIAVLKYFRIGRDFRSGKYLESFSILKSLMKCFHV
jgi:hypothetical protein